MVMILRCKDSRNCCGDCYACSQAEIEFKVEEKGDEECLICGEILDQLGECPNGCTENDLYLFAKGFYK